MASKPVSLSAQLPDLPVVRGHAPWPGHEYVKGWGVFGLPFDSGHVLALHVFPENDFSPYRTVWHRDPGGRWSIHVDGPRLDTACPRYYGPACTFTGYARIGLTWSGPATLRVTMDSPALEWTLTATSTRLLDLLNTCASKRATSRRCRWRPARSTWSSATGSSTCAQTSQPCSPRSPACSSPAGARAMGALPRTHCVAGNNARSGSDPLAALLRQEPPRGKLQYICVAARAVIGSHEVVSDHE